MKKVLLMFLLMMPTIIISMQKPGHKKSLVQEDQQARKRKRSKSPETVKQRYSKIFNTELVLDTEILPVLIQEKGLHKTKDELAKRKEKLAFERGLSQFLLKSSKNLSPAVKRDLEENESKLEWQQNIAKLLDEEIQAEEAALERTIYENYEEVSRGLAEIDEWLNEEEIETKRNKSFQGPKKYQQLMDIIENEIRQNLSSHAKDMEKKEAIKSEIIKFISAARKIMTPDAFGKFKRNFSGPEKHRFADQSYY